MNDKKMSARDRIRAGTVGRKPQFISRIIDYYPPIYSELKQAETGELLGLELIGYEDDPIKVEIRQPSVKNRNDLVKKCRREDNSFDELEFIVQAVIAFAYDPESGEKLYEQTDYDSLMMQPAGDFVDQFGEEAVKLLTMGEPEKNSVSSVKTKKNKRSTLLPKS